MNLIEENEYRFEVTSDRLKGSLMGCLRLPPASIAFHFKVEAFEKNIQGLCLFDPIYGPIGKIEIKQQSFNQSLLSFIEPGYPDLSELEKILPQLLQNHPNLPVGVRLSFMVDPPEKTAELLRPFLYQVRMQRFYELKEWIFERLKIFGYRNLVSHIPPGINPETFTIPILATCAQVAVLARQISKDWKEKDSLAPACLVQDPDTFFAVGNVLPDNGPLNVILTKKNAAMKCIVRSTSPTECLLNVILADREENWVLWDILRDEMERAGYIRISGPTNFISVTEELSQKVVNQPDPQSVPVKEDHKRILDLWCSGKPAKEIARQTGRTEKTIHNLLSIWRKEYGEAAVPRRR
jgi:hypothetical protein